VRWIALLLALGSFAISAEAPQTPTRAWQVTQIDAKIAALQSQIDRLQEQKRRLLDLPDIPPPQSSRVQATHIHTGPRNGKYHYTPTGKKVYETSRK
jgi:hypothetical protein